MDNKQLEEFKKEIDSSIQDSVGTAVQNMFMQSVDKLTATIDEMKKNQEQIALNTLSIKNKQKDVVIPSLINLDKRVETLELSIRGNGKKGIGERLNDLEDSSKLTVEALFDKKEGLVNYVFKQKISYKWVSMLFGILGGGVIVFFNGVIVDILKNIFNK